MDRIAAMRIFDAIDPERSLAATARRLGVSPATVSRALTLLEQEAGETLLERSTRHLSFTERGREHRTAYSEILACFDSLARNRQDDTLSGTITITAPELFGCLVVVPALHSLRLANPGLSIRLLLLDRIVDLIGEGIDLAIRIANVPDANLEVINVAEVSRVTCAAHVYLDRAGQPQTPEDLKDHLCIGLNAAGLDEQWRFSHSGRLRSQRIRCSMTTNNAAASISAAEMGGGIIQALSYQIASQLEKGRLQPVLTDYSSPPIPVQILHRNSAHTAPGIKVVAEHLSKAMII